MAIQTKGNTPRKESATLTPEDVENLVLNGSIHELVEAYSYLEEKERKKLSKTANQLYKTVRKRDFGQQVSNALKSLAKRIAKGTIPALYVNAQLTVLAMCPFSSVKQLTLWYISNDKEHAMVKVLLDRKPDWLQDWLEFRLEKEMPGLTWDTIRKLVRGGACQKPQSDAYIRLMGAYFFRWKQFKNEPHYAISTRLIAEPDTLEDVYRLFEVETWAFNSTHYDKNPPVPEGFESWPIAIRTLIDKGHLDRDRVLDASLKGLTTGFKSDQLTSYRRMHLFLEPTLDEVHARESLYRSLLTTRTGSVVSFGLKMLSRLLKAKRIDGDAFLKSARAVFDLTSKGQPKQAIKMTSSLVKQDAGLAPLASEFLLHALSHPEPDIQELALDKLEPLYSPSDKALHDTIRSQAALVTPSLKARVLALCGEMPESTSTDEDAFDAHWFDEQHDRLQSIPKPVRENAGLFDTLTYDSYPPPLSFDLMDHAILQDLEPITPIDNIQDLIDVVSHAVEVVDSADEVERILDGLSRLCDQKPADFETRTSSLLKRVKTPQHSESAKGLVSGWGGICIALQDLLLTWLTGKLYETALPRYNTPPPPFLFTKRRLQELKKRIYKQAPAPLLAAPTHTQGWIDPLLFVPRLRDIDDSWISKNKEDLMQALLRLAPEHRDLALEKCQDLPGRVGRIVRYALGGHESPKASENHEYEIWVTAGRARSPRKSLNKMLSVFKVTDDFPDSMEPCQLLMESFNTNIKGLGRHGLQTPSDRDHYGQRGSSMEQKGRIHGSHQGSDGKVVGLLQKARIRRHQPIVVSDSNNGNAQAFRQNYVVNT